MNEPFADDEQKKQMNKRTKDYPWISTGREGREEREGQALKLVDWDGLGGIGEAGDAMWVCIFLRSAIK